MKFLNSWITIRATYQWKLIKLTKSGNALEYDDHIEGDAHVIINCIIFSMGCILFLLCIIVCYDTLRYTFFGKSYLSCCQWCCCLKKSIPPNSEISCLNNYCVWDWVACSVRLSESPDPDGFSLPEETGGYAV